MNSIIENVAEATDLPQQAAVQEDNQYVSEGAGIPDDGDSATIDEQDTDEKIQSVPLHISGEQQPVAAKPKIQTGMVQVALLRPYAKNAEIYHERQDEALLESIRVNGVRNDLLADEDGVVYGGTTRLRYAMEVGLTEVPVKVIAFQSEDEKLLRLLDDNLYRRKTNVEETREYMARKAIEARAAASRKVEAGKKRGTAAEEVKTVAPLSAKKGKARDIASEGSGRTGVSLEKGSKVIEAADKMRKQGDGKTADELLTKLDKDGYAPALKYAESLGLAPKPGSKDKVTNAKPKSDGATAKAVKPASNGQGSAVDNATKVSTAPVPTHESNGGAQAATVIDVEDNPPVVQIITACDKLAADLDALTVGDLTADQKGNLYRVLERVANWLAFRDEVLQVPARK